MIKFILMNRSRVPGILFALTLFLAFQSLAAPKKLALVVALANYPPENNWAKISSDNDVALIKQALIVQGFQPDDIMMIADAQGTKSGIVSAIKTLTQKAQKGDVVVIHFSSHGQQIYDDDGDEIDGYDEAIVPYDAGLYFAPGIYEGERHLRDDELGALVTTLREKVGPEGNVLVIMDSCHSGTGTRALRSFRGTEVKFQPDGYSPRIKEGTDVGFAESGSTRADDLKLAPMVLLSGASQDEVNYEYYDYYSGINYGSLSYAFSKHMSEASNDLTYRALFDKIKVEMSYIAPNQTPQVEGDIDREILGGKAVEQTDYFNVRSWYDENSVTINAGNLVGIFNRTTVAFYPSNTADPSLSTPLSSGTVVWSGMLESNVALDNPMDEMIAMDSWVFIDRQNYGDMRVRVKVDILGNALFQKSLVDKLSEMPTVNLVDSYPDLLIEMNDQTRGSALQVITSDEFLIYSADIQSANTNAEVERIIDKVKSFGQANLLRKVDLYDPYIDIVFDLIPITIKQAGTKWEEDQRYDRSTKIGLSGGFEFNEGDCFKIVAGNVGAYPAYFQILDIQPDNSIGILIPSENRTAAEYRLNPGEVRELEDIFVFGAPYGTEIFKLVASDEILNLKGIVTTRGKTDIEKPSPFEALFSESYEQTRASTLSVKPNSASMFAVPVIVKP